MQRYLWQSSHIHYNAPMLFLYTNISHLSTTTQTHFRAMMKRQICKEILSLYFLFIYYYYFFFDCLSHQVVLTLLEPKLANKYNEMLKRTIEFQIQYSSQKCVRPWSCVRFCGGHIWQEHEVTLERDRTPVGGARAMAAKSLLINETFLEGKKKEKAM